MYPTILSVKSVFLYVTVIAARRGFEVLSAPRLLGLAVTVDAFAVIGEIVGQLARGRHPHG